MGEHVPEGRRGASLLDRAWRRRHIVIAMLVATFLHALLGGLGSVWSFMGVGACVAGIALWPDRSRALVERGAPSARSDAANPAEGRGLPLTVIDGLWDAALLLDARGHVVSGNAAAQAIAPLLAGRPLSLWNRSPELLDATKNAIATALPQRCQVRLSKPVERTLDVLATPIAEMADRGPSILVVLRDLTEQEQLARMRVDFVANASHELRTPLASLRGFIETLQGAARSDPAAQSRFLGIMQTQAERMSRLIEDLLSLNRIEMREHVAPTGIVDLAAVVRDAATALKPAAEKAGIAIREANVTGAASVTGDRDELMQVAQNLMQNALKYGRPDGHVTISITGEGKHVVFEIADDGIGIASEHIPRLTERFYRASAKDSKERGGTGLGLAIVKHIVNRHRGELRIVSTLGRGSTFTVVLAATTINP